MIEGAPLAEDDRLFWEIQRRYEARPMVCGVYLALAGPPARARLQTLLEGATEAHPRLGWRLAEGSGGPRWEPLGTGSPRVAWEHDASLLGHDDFLQRAAARMNERLPDGLPWRCWIVSDRPEGDAGARFHGIWIRWQHALTDGEGMLDLLGALCAAPDEGPCGELRATSAALRSDRKPVVHEGEGWRRGGVRELLRQRRAMARGRRDRSHAGGAAMEIRRLELPLPHERVLALARRHGVSTNDVALSLSAWAIERHQARGASRDDRGPFAVLSPVSRRGADGGVVVGNRSQALRLLLEALPRDPVARIRTIGSQSAAAIASAAPVPYWIYAALFRLPRALLDRVLASAPPYISNYLPWADRPQRIAGQAITAIHGFTPPLPYHGCTFAYSSYAGRLSCALTTDPSIVADAATLATLIEEAAATLAQGGP